MPLILSNTAARGHNVVLVMGGLAPRGRESFVATTLEGALKRKEGAGTFGIVCFKAWTKWSFCPALFVRLPRLIRSCDFISLHSVYCFPVLAGYLLARLYHKPYGLWPHGALAPFQRTISARKKWLYDRIIGRRILNDASALFFSAAGEWDETRSLRLKAPPAIIPHGFDASEFESLPPRGRFRAKFLNGHRGPLLVFLARLNSKKGLDLLVRAMALVAAQKPEARLAIAGAGDPRSFEARVRGWVKDAGVEACTLFTGHIANDTKRELLADADVFVLPSQAENFGFSVFEAMACRVPVIVSDTINYAGVIAQNGAGLAIERGPNALAESILRLLQDPELRRQMGSDGYRLAHSFSWAECGSRVERVMLSILEDRSIPEELRG
jgi:glycosyltransferase involved in cell wall biosynthesis